MEMSRLRELGRLVADREDRLLAEGSVDFAMRTVLAERVSTRRERALRVRLVQAVVLAMFSGALLAVVALLVAGSDLAGRGLGALGEPAPSLGFHVGTPARPGILNESVAAPSAAPVPIQFSDGSQVTLAPHARARVVALRARGADIVLESGSARVSVVGHGHADFGVQSGPFTVHVTGTRFDVAFDAQALELTVSLHEGRVIVTGCGVAEGRSVAAGQRLVVACDGRPPALTSTEDERAASSEKPATGTAAEQPRPGVSARGIPSAARPAPSTLPSRREEPGWALLARDGRFEAAYRAARSAGFRGESARADAGDLLLLADSARHAGSSEDARLAYTILRERFNGGEPAARAAYGLGLLDSRAGRHASAAVWYEAYLTERPGGALAPTALGRLLESRVKLGDLRAARGIAETYLSRYPTGPHAAEARRVIDDTVETHEPTTSP